MHTEAEGPREQPLILTRGRVEVERLMKMTVPLVRMMTMCGTGKGRKRKKATNV
jgi:hypothetical protein